MEQRPGYKSDHSLYPKSVVLFLKGLFQRRADIALRDTTGKLLPLPYVLHLAQEYRDDKIA